MEKLEDMKRSEAFLFGGAYTVVPKGADPTQAFLHVVENGINWEAPVGERSSLDFAKSADFGVIGERFNEVFPKYLAYIRGNVLSLAEDECGFVEESDYDDSLLDVTEVLSMFHKARPVSSVGASNETLEAVLDKLEELAESVEGVSQEADNAIAALRQQLLAFRA